MMALPILGLIPGVLKTLAKVLGGDIFKQAAEAVENLQVPPEKQAELRLALLQHEYDMKQLTIEEMKAAMAEALAMVSSSDKYVARARPTGLYVYYVVCLALVIGMMAGLKVDPTAILTVIVPMSGVGGMYVYKRTQEKLNGNGNGD